MTCTFSDAYLFDTLLSSIIQLYRYMYARSARYGGAFFNIDSRYPFRSFRTAFRARVMFVLVYMYTYVYATASYQSSSITREIVSAVRKKSIFKICFYARARAVGTYIHFGFFLDFNCTHAVVLCAISNHNAPRRVRRIDLLRVIRYARVCRLTFPRENWQF